MFFLLHITSLFILAGIFTHFVHSWCLCLVFVQCFVFFYTKISLLLSAISAVCSFDTPHVCGYTLNGAYWTRTDDSGMLIVKLSYWNKFIFM